MMSEIAAPAHEQSSGIEQVNEAVTQLDKVMQQNAALVEEATAAATSMASAGDAALRSSVAQFRVDERMDGGLAACRPLRTRARAPAQRPQRLPAARADARAAVNEEDWKEF